MNFVVDYINLIIENANLVSTTNCTFSDYDVIRQKKENIELLIRLTTYLKKKLLKEKSKIVKVHSKSHQQRKDDISEFKDTDKI